MVAKKAAALIDPAAEANNVAKIFYGLSDAVDDFRLATRNPPLTDLQAARLKDESQALDTRAHYFTAEAIGATLQTIQSDLAHIKTLTAEVKHQVATLKAIDKVINVVTSVLSLATAIAAGNADSIGSAVQALAGELGNPG